MEVHLRSTTSQTVAVDQIAPETEIADIWSQVQDRLRAFLARRVPVSVDVDDLLQEIFIKMYRARDRLDEIDQVDAWLYSIARNVLIDRSRLAWSRNEVVSDAPPDQDPAGPRSLSIDDESGSRRELASCLRPMLAALPEDQRVALELTDLGDLTQREAAEAVGVSVSGMKSRVQRGRRGLRAELTSCCRIELDRRGGIIEHQPTAADTSDDCCPSKD